MTTPKIEVCQFTQEFLDKAADLELSVYGVKEAWPKDAFAVDIERGYARYLVLLADGELIGYAGSWNLLGELEVSTVTIAPHWQGRGLGVYLFANLIARGLNDGVEAATLEVRFNNEPALSVYRRFGFKGVGIRKKYYENRYDAIIMRVENMQDPAYVRQVQELAGRCNLKGLDEKYEQPQQG
ncbi:MAG: ribosomal protein S18-alanine N-acetyltransferase [Candidatus Bruticola sp.]